MTITNVYGHAKCQIHLVTLVKLLFDFREYLATFKKTVAMHEVFLQRISAHSKLREDVNFKVFLEYEEDVSYGYHVPVLLFDSNSRCDTNILIFSTSLMLGCQLLGFD